MGRFVFSDASERKLEGVHDDLVEVARRAIEITEMDFGIVAGLRDMQEQLRYVAQGASHTIYSMHLIGHAVDVMPYCMGRYQNTWPFYFPVADAFQTASQELSIDIHWGGAWSTDMTRFRTSQEAQMAYIMAKNAMWESKKTKQRRKLFLDGPHFELNRHHYRPDFTAFQNDGDEDDQLEFDPLESA